jgi:hypothetical protein
MVWVSAAFLAITAVLFIAAWRFRGKLRWPSTEPRDDRLDRWLVQHYRLTSPGERIDVYDAVRHGRAVGDPALRGAARGLAAALLSGRLRDPKPAALLLTGLYVLVGALYLVTILIRGGGREVGLGITVGATWLLGACAWRWRSLRLPRRTLERALELNQGDMGTAIRDTGHR